MHCSCVTGKPRHEGVTSPGGKASTQRLAQWSWGERKASSSDSQRPEPRGRTAGRRQDPGTPRLAHPASHVCQGSFQQVPSGRRAAPALGAQRCLAPSSSCRCQWGQGGSRHLASLPSWHPSHLLVVSGLRGPILTPRALTGCWWGPGSPEHRTDAGALTWFHPGPPDTIGVGVGTPPSSQVCRRLNQVASGGQGPMPWQGQPRQLAIG